MCCNVAAHAEFVTTAPIDIGALDNNRNGYLP
jgi:hypothetical protein